MAHVLDDVEHKQLFYDSKTILQEIIQAEKEGDVTYVITGEHGPDHDKNFEAEVLVEKERIGRGRGRTKKAAEQQAAYNAICRIKKSR